MLFIFTFLFFFQELIIGEEIKEPGIKFIFEGAIKDEIHPKSLHLDENETNIHIEARVNWPLPQNIKGFEMHYGKSNLINNKSSNVINFFKNSTLGWVVEHKDKSFIGGTYLHGIFENNEWRRHWINKIRQKKGLNELNFNEKDNIDKRERLLNLLTDAFETNINLDKLI